MFAKVVAVSKKKKDTPVKVTFIGYDKCLAAYNSHVDSFVWLDLECSPIYEMFKMFSVMDYMNHAIFTIFIEIM